MSKDGEGLRVQLAAGKGRLRVRIVNLEISGMEPGKSGQLVGEFIERMLALPEAAAPVRACRSCGCTDADCSQCVEVTGQPCYWVEEDLCSRCAELDAEDVPLAKPRRRKGAAP